MAKHYFFGFSRWKHRFITPFFDEIPKEDFVFINPYFKKSHFRLAMKKGLNSGSKIYIWGRKSFPEIEKYAIDHNILIRRIEDGFIRSVALGSDLTQSYSLVVDSEGIYFDPTRPSDLETILNTHIFNESLLERSRRLQVQLTEKKISKYNIYEDASLPFPGGTKIILIPGQIEDDASVIYGADGMTNLELLQQVRQKYPNAYIIYKPHPDILAGNRMGSVETEEALKYCDDVVNEVSIDTVLQISDEVHTMTSLVGFEALLRGIKVVTYGMPFYAGWGLTENGDMRQQRSRQLSLDMLVAGALIVYPRYINPVTLQRCEVEGVIELLDQERERYRTDQRYRLQKEIRNFISRKMQFLLHLFI